MSSQLVFAAVLLQVPGIPFLFEMLPALGAVDSVGASSTKTLGRGLRLSLGQRYETFLP